MQVHRPLALENAAQARALLRSCVFCAHKCAADRTQGPARICHSDASCRIFRESFELAGEVGLTPSYSVYLSGCNLACSFCINGVSSQNGLAGSPLDLSRLAERIEAAAPLARSVTISGGEPAVHLEAALEIAAWVPRQLQLVWKTNAYTAVELLPLLAGVADVVVADYKFGNGTCARRLAGVPHYCETVEANLSWFAAHTRLIVRHLLMPGHWDCCFLPVLQAVARLGAPLSLMGGFMPAGDAAQHGELGRLLRESEVAGARREARGRGLTLVPWVMAPGVDAASPESDEIWIDRDGRVFLKQPSAELSRCLRRIGAELALDFEECRDR